MTFREKVAASQFARAAAMPGRTKQVAHHISVEFALASKWLVTSREHHNYTYDLTPRNLEHLAWWVSHVSGAPVDNCRSWIAEILTDHDLEEHVKGAVQRSDRRGLADREVRIGRRAGWYALIRALKPTHVVETGTDKGLGSVVIAAALLRNGGGHLTTMDINPAAGYLLSGPYIDAVSVVIGDSIASIQQLGTDIGVFIHDSDHTAEHESLELRAVTPKLLPAALVVSDNAHATDSLALWAEATGRKFSYFREEPSGHWYPGAGIGAAWSPHNPAV